MTHRENTNNSIKVKKYGVRRAVGAVSPKWERVGNGVGLIAQAAIGTEKVKNEFMEKVYPYNEMKPCNLSSGGDVTAYLGEPGFNWFGENGDVMLEVPMYYVDRYVAIDPKDGIEYEYRWLAKEKLAGMQVDPMFRDGDAIKEKVFLPIFCGSLTEEDGMKIIRSCAGATPLVETTRENFRELAVRKGIGWSLNDVWTSFALQHLFLIMFADSDAKTVLGGSRTDMAFDGIKVLRGTKEKVNSVILQLEQGENFLLGQQIAIGSRAGEHSIALDRTVTSIEKNASCGECKLVFDGNPVLIPADCFVWSCAQHTGASIQMKSANGCVAGGTKQACRFLYIEDWIGNTWDWNDGDNIKNNVHYLSYCREDYGERRYSGSYHPVRYKCTNIEGYLTELGYDAENPMVALPTQVGGSAVTYYCNSYFCSKSGERAPLHGSSLRNGKYAGAFFWDVDDPPESEIWNVGGRPLYK